jgi:UDP-N-acetylmuramoyl-tripeptide--D-alanyl-D-alanine ligase
MKELTLGTLAQWCGGSLTKPEDAAVKIHGMRHDSRQVVPGDLFVALVGERVDGHDFVRAAADAGAAAVMVEHPVETSLPQLVVPNALKAYGAIAAAYRLETDVAVVAITGSVGKTTTKEMISCVLEGKYSVAKTQGNHNNDLGLPITIMDMPADSRIAVLELGMNHFGEMSYLTSIAQPDVVVITNIGTMHIEHLGTREGILKAKLEIMQGLRDEGVAVFNGDEPLLWNIREGEHRRLYFGIENDQCDVLATDIVPRDGGVSFTAKGLGRELQVFVPQEGRHSVYNALAAITVGLLCELPEELICHQLEAFRNTGMRQHIFVEKGFTIIEDCYNAGPESMEAALSVLRDRKTEGRRIAVLGDMLELGTRSGAEHYRVGRLAAETADLLFTCGHNSARTIVGAITGGMPQKKALHFEDCQTLAKALASAARPGDVLLFKGSRGMKLEQALKLFLEDV